MLRPLGAGLPREHRLSPRPALVEFMVEQVALGEVYLCLLQVSPVSIFPPMVHDYLCITNANIILGTNKDHK